MSYKFQNISDLRTQLLNNGYKPVPVTTPNSNDKAAGKRPAINNWRDEAGNASIDKILGWSSLANASNTGILAGDVIGLDIDVLDPVIAEEIGTLITNELESLPPVRFGHWPKRLIVVRAEKPFKKMVSPEYILPNGSKGQFEVLGEGQQFVAYGTHPKTLNQYEWEGASPADVSMDDLPCVSEGFCLELLPKIHEIMIKNGAVTKAEFEQREEEGKRIAHVEHQPPTQELVEEALSFIPNRDLSYNEWFPIAAALHNALGEEGFSLFDVWSKQSSKYVQRTTVGVWRGLKRGQGITVGTLFWYANQNGWRRSNQKDDRPTIIISGGKLPDIIDQSEEALIESGVEVFQRGGFIARPVWRQSYAAENKQQASVGFVHVTEDGLSELFMRAANYKRKDADGNLIPVDLSTRYARTYLARHGKWKLPEVTGIIYAPLVCPDGSIIVASGYDKKTGIYAAFDSADFQPLPQTATFDDALKALNVIRSLFESFPFLHKDSGQDESVMLSALMTGVARAVLPTAPMFGITAPSAGSGKSLLVDIISIIIYGRPAAVTSPGKTEEEMEKRVGAAILQGDAVISLDNCTETLQGGFLCQVITQERVKVRILGKSKSVEVPTNTLLVATGNNLSFADDMNRRVILCSVDPRMERPEERQFDKNPLEIAVARRKEFIFALQTIFLAFIQAGSPQKAPILGSFPVWSKFIRSILVWLGLPDPCGTMDRVRENDPILQRNRALLNEIDAAFSDRPFTTAELIEKAEERKKEDGDKWVYRNLELRSILSEVSGGKRDLNKNSIGKCLRNLKDRIIDGVSLIIDGRRHGTNVWRVVNGPQSKIDRLADDLL